MSFSAHEQHNFLRWRSVVEIGAAPFPLWLLLWNTELALAADKYRHVSSESTNADHEGCRWVEISVNGAL